MKEEGEALEGKFGNQRKASDDGPSRDDELHISCYRANSNDMLWSKLFIPTLREAPAGVDDPGTRLLIRAGYQRASVNLVLAQRSLTKLAALLRAELDAMGGQELSSSNEPLSSAAPGALRSYRQLPQLWYQIRDGVVEICTFYLDPDRIRRGLEEALGRVLTNCGVPFTLAVAQSGREFGVLSPAGTTKIAWNEEAGYAALIGVAHAIAKPPLAADPEGTLAPERFHTPDRKTIADLVDFTRLPATSQIKSLVQFCDGKPYLILVRGDHQLERTKLAAAVGASEARPATAAEISTWFGATPGSLGPVGVTNMPILSDLCLQGRLNMICGANEDDYHLRHVTPGVDFKTQFLDLRRVEEGDMCPAFPAAIEIRNVHSLGRVSTTVSFDLKVTGESGREVAPFATVSRLALDMVLTVAAEFNNDQEGLTLPRSLTPFDVVITPANYGAAAQRNAALSLYEQCLAEGLATLLDDRDERPGVKFKDADLIGIPARINVGKKLAQGLVEVVKRNPRQISDVPLAQAMKLV